MQDTDLIVGLDIGTTKIAACAGRIHEGGIEIAAVSETPHSGARKGMITDVDETAGAIAATMETLQQTAGAPLSGAVVVGIGGTEVTTTESVAAVPVSQSSGDINDDDIANVLEAAQAATLPSNRTVIHCLPITFTTDHESNVRDPLGMQSIRLEVNAQLITASTLAVRNLERSVQQAGLQISDVVFNPLAAQKAVLSRRQTESGVVLMDIGSATTDVAIFEENHLVRAAVLPIGSQHITNDIAIGLRTSLEVAEQLKREHGSAMASLVKANEVVHLADYSEDDTESIKRQYLAEIIEARLHELFGLITDELKDLDRDQRLPAGVVLVGNGARLDGLVEYTKETLKLPATVAKPRLELSTVIVDTMDAPDYTTSVGLLLWGLEHGTQASSGGSLPRPALPSVDVSSVLSRAKDLFKQFLP